MSFDSSSGVLVFDAEAHLQYVDAVASRHLDAEPSDLLAGTPSVLQAPVTAPGGASYPSLGVFVEQMLAGELASPSVVCTESWRAEARLMDGSDSAGGVVVTVQSSDASPRSSRDLLRRTQQLAGVGGWTYDPATDVMEGTEETYRICELSPEADLTLEQALTLYPPETAAVIRTAAQRCLQHGEPFDEEGPMVTAEGTSRWVRVSGEARRDEDGRIVKMVGTVQDLTERHAIEERLREQKEWLQSITENVSGGLYRSTDDGLVYANQALLDLFGYESLEEMTSADPDSFYAHPEVRQKLIQSEMEQGGIDGVEVEYQRKDGSTFTGLLRSTQVMGTDGTRYYDGVVTDVTEQKTRERALREHRKKMNALYETTERLFTADSRAEVANQIQHLLDEAFDYPLTGVSFVEQDTIVPEHVSMTDDHEMPPIQVLEVSGDSLSAQALRSGDPKMVENLAETTTEVEYGDLQSVVCMPIAREGVIYLGRVSSGRLDSFDLHLVDVLAKKAAVVLARIEHERQLKAAKQEAEEASRLKSTLLANMSHEIRTPLTSIIGFARILKETLSGRDARHAERVHRGGERLMDTLDSVLQLSKLEAGVTEPGAEPVDFVRTVRQTVDLYRPDAKEGRIELDFVTDREALPGKGDPAVIQRIVSNLLNNALKFTSAGGAVTIQLQAREDIVEVVVSDTGIGISDHFRDRLYDAFTQESEGLKREHEGSGLGLAIVKRLVDLMEGQIDVESTKGEGTCFHVRLPRRRTLNS